MQCRTQTPLFRLAASASPPGRRPCGPAAQPSAARARRRLQVGKEGLRAHCARRRRSGRLRREVRRL
jgi:hypothetical protein